MSGPDITEKLDSRIAAFRADLADRRLQGRVEALRFVDGIEMSVASPVAPFRSRPDIAASVTATKLRGERLRVFERKDGWAWAQSDQDLYVGYLPERDLAEGWPSAGWAVSALRTHLYPAPDLKKPPLGWAPLGARLAIPEPSNEQARFVQTASGGWIYQRHLRRLDEPAPDWVAVVEQFLGVPYLWGGDSAEGIDCSGLIRVALDAAGQTCPRDSDMQERDLGAALPDRGELRRGDLVFWRGHVGVMRDADILLHANAWTMSVASEPLKDATTRIEAMDGGAATSMRRLPG